jgi:hypothetical protein
MKSLSKNGVCKFTNNFKKPKEFLSQIYDLKINYITISKNPIMQN